MVKGETKPTIIPSADSLLLTIPYSFSSLLRSFKTVASPG